MLYKYLPEDRANIIESMSIRFSPLRSLNDPFDSNPLVDLSELMRSGHEQQREKIISETIYDDEGNIVDPQELGRMQDAIFVDSVQKNNPWSTGQQLLNNIGDRFGVLCLSRTKTSLLMWNHYASEGQGYLLEFDSKHDFFNQKKINGLASGPRPVRYSTERPEVRPNDDDYYEKLFCHKPLEWSYEEEERIFCNYSAEYPIEENTDSYGQKVRLSDLPNDVIKGVFFGYNSTEKLISKISSALVKNGVVCPLYKGSICKNEYKIVFEEINI
jgi:hypothetical protein